MELDTGSAVSIITHELYMKIFTDIPLQKTELLLKTYTGENITPVGGLKANVKVQRPATITVGSLCHQGQGPGVDGEEVALQDTFRLVCHQITECFTSYTTCQRASGHHTRQILGCF